MCISEKGMALALILYLLVYSADYFNFCNQFRPRSGPTKQQARSESKLLDTLMVFQLVVFEKNQQRIIIKHKAGLKLRVCNKKNIFFYISTKTYVVGTHKIRFIETIL